MKKTNSPIQYLALLRGINVGGNNIIKMTDLKKCFEAMGLSDVTTYIQSGNVMFNSDEKDKNKILNKVEEGLSRTFKYDAKAVIISYKELKGIVKNTPTDFGKDSEAYRYDVIFLKEPLTAKTAMLNVSAREGVDAAYEGKKVLYFSRLIAKAGQSYLTKIISLPVYKNMTIRNWNTTTKLLTLMEKG
ncbi:MAG: DUF1697 domain-containing protein [Ignavibacteriaceae bacterium]